MLFGTSLTKNGVVILSCTVACQYLHLDLVLLSLNHMCIEIHEI